MAMSLRELTRKATPMAVTTCQAKQMRSTARKLVIRRVSHRLTIDQIITAKRAGTATQKCAVPAKRQSLNRNSVLRIVERMKRLRA